MNLIIGSKYLLADIATAFDVTGKEHLVIVTKASWRIPAAGQRPQPIAPTPLAVSDVFVGAPGESAMLYGADYARFKPFCDVLFNASAHSPHGQAVREMQVGWQVGQLQKALMVTGPRYWQADTQGGAAKLTAPKEFISMPLHYGLAFGGSRPYRNHHQGGDLFETNEFNPTGIGWAGPQTLNQIAGQLAPCLTAINDPVLQPHGGQSPIAFSAIARNWAPRKMFSGTYDSHWQQEIAPLLPLDFDERYHQCAPSDQQMAYPRGGETVLLWNMMAGRTEVNFVLPQFENLKLRVLRKDYSIAQAHPVVDTLYFEPDAERFSAIWRASIPIRRRIQEFDTVAIGPINPAWWESKRLGLHANCADCNERQHWELRT